jgi:hypothetical protein
MASATQYYAKPGDAETFASIVLKKAGLPAAEAELMAKCLVQADVRGVVSGPIYWLSTRKNQFNQVLGYSWSSPARAIPITRYSGTG